VGLRHRPVTTTSAARVSAGGSWRDSCDSSLPCRIFLRKGGGFQIPARFGNECETCWVSVPLQRPAAAHVVVGLRPEKKKSPASSRA
jgi:hypothetical protein